MKENKARLGKKWWKLFHYVEWSGKTSLAWFHLSRDQNEGRAEAAIWNQIEGRARAKVLGKDRLSALKYMKEAGISEAEWANVRVVRYGVREGAKDLYSEIESQRKGWAAKNVTIWLINRSKLAMESKGTTRRPIRSPLKNPSEWWLWLRSGWSCCWSLEWNLHNLFAIVCRQEKFGWLLEEWNWRRAGLWVADPESRMAQNLKCIFNIQLERLSREGVYEVGVSKGRSRPMGSLTTLPLRHSSSLCISTVTILDYTATLLAWMPTIASWFLLSLPLLSQ